MNRDFLLFVRKRWKRLLGLSVGIVVCILIIVGLYYLRGIMADSMWNGNDRVTGVLVGNGGNYPVVLYTYEDTAGLTLFAVPSEVRISAAHKLGEYRVSNLKSLAKQEGDYDILKESLSIWAGVPIDFVLMKNGTIDCDITDKECFTRQMGLWSYKEFETTLSPWDWWQWSRMISHIDRVHMSILDGASIARLNQTKDHVDYLTVPSELLDQLINVRFADKRVLDEALTVAVISTYAQPGAAADITRIVQGMGGRVVQAELVPTDQADCQIRSSNSLKDSVSVKRLLDILPCKWSDLVEDDRRANIEIWLGKELIDSL